MGFLRTYPYFESMLSFILSLFFSPSPNPLPLEEGTSLR